MKCLSGFIAATNSDNSDLIREKKKEFIQSLLKNLKMAGMAGEPDSRLILRNKAQKLTTELA